jgi:uncharacterized protein YecA (UPF0149 family)
MTDDTRSPAAAAPHTPVARADGHAHDHAHDHGHAHGHAHAEADDCGCGHDHHHHGHHHHAPVETYMRATPKVGRNEACPCGSGKKYKKCCMAA